MTFWGKRKFLSLMAIRNPACTLSHFHLKKKKKKKEEKKKKNFDVKYVLDSPS